MNDMNETQSFDLVIRGGTVVLPDGPAQVDIGVRAGRIAALAASLPVGRAELSALDRIVLPGGVDAHCHMDQQPWEGRSTADDFRSGTLSALCGGTTTVIPFAMQMRGQSLAEVVADYHERARPKAHIDYAFHLIVGDPTPRVLEEELPRLIAQGCTSVKIYLTYEGLKLDDYEVLEVLNVARREGALTMVHAENDACIRWLTEQFLKARKTHLRYHVLAHPAAGDREATFRAISLAEVIETPILICHVSAAGAAEEIRRAKQRGLPVYAETCPQYLFLSAEDIDTPDLRGAMCVCTPPPRARENQPEMWRGLLDGTLEVFSSDHSPWHYTDKIAGGPDTPFTRIPNGVPGIETRLPLLFSAAVNGGRMSLAQFAQLTATTPARLYGLYPRKGAIVVGADADLALWDAQREVTISNAMLHHATDHTPYEGMTVRGWPVTTVSRGDIIWHEGEVRSTPGRGRFLAAARPFTPRTSLPPVLDA
ncbi:dihydropyrimidinase [Paraburkholderia sp. SARCC-3016]|nr:dihydropyrimidinase [Paraburkholderia sp. SARCC-3016]MDQ7982061.1 dihydropyrimidinase [Paraburkholderia sp. SARCC-3016]